MTFARFMQQYRAVGREKGDGYDPSMFEGLTAGEREQARGLLLERGLRGDTVDLNGLRWLGDDAVVAALRGAVLPGGDKDMARIETLFALTDDPAELDPLWLYLDGRDGDERRRSAWLLARLPLPAGLASALAGRLCRARLGEAALPLALAWLATQGVPASDPATLATRVPLVRSILDAWPWRRRRVLARISRELGRSGQAFDRDGDTAAAGPDGPETGSSPLPSRGK